LLDFLWHGARALPPAATSVKVVLVVGALAGLLPMAASMFALTYEARHRRRAGFVRCVTSAMRTMPALVLLLVIGTGAQATALGVGFLVAKGIELWFEASLGEAGAQRLGVPVGLIFALVASGFGVVHDLSRAAVVHSRVRAIRALSRGARAFGSAPLSIWWSWAWRAIAALVPILAVGLVATRIGGRGGVALVLLAALHQAVVLSRVAFRLSWLARALRAVGDDERSTNPDAAPAARSGME
jgi:hypothetical protein